MKQRPNKKPRNDENKPNLKTDIHTNENENKQNISKEIDEKIKTSSSSESGNTEKDHITVYQNNFSKEIKQILQVKKMTRFANERFGKVIQDFEFHFIFDVNQIDSVAYKLKKSDFIVINHYEEPTLIPDTRYFIVCFEKTLIIFNQDFLSRIFNCLLQNNNKLLFLFMPETKRLFEKCTDIEYKELECDKKIFLEAIYIMNYYVSIPKSFAYKSFYKNIISCILGYLFQKSYSKTKSNRIKRFFACKEKNHEKIFSEDEFISLGHIGVGICFIAELVYHIEYEELLVIKKPAISNKEVEKLKDREISNYSNMNHPLIPKFYGKTKDNGYLITEYINGDTLCDINLSEFSKEDKITIIFELLLIIQYLHSNKYVYRDLKPNNVIIDKNKTAILIDFDRMVKINDSLEDKNCIIDFISDFSAPEIYNGELNYANDIYSIGKFIGYWMIKGSKTKKLDEPLDEDDFINNIFSDCTSFHDKRPSIDKLIWAFYIIFFSHKLNDLSLVADPNNPNAQFNLGIIYYEGKYIKRDIDKSINYLSLAADQNHLEAQFNLGKIYYEGKYIDRDINKSIHYLSLAADQNHLEAQFNLGIIYYEGKYIKQDINKSIHYLLLAADQNHLEAQFNLGIIYYEGKYIKQDINKSIHYLSLAANQNHLEAQNILAIFYSDRIYIRKSMIKAINYFIQSASNGCTHGYFAVGFFFHEGKYVERDIKKSIHHYIKASTFNNQFAKNNLGVIYRYGCGDEIQPNCCLSMSFFEEAVQSFNDKVSMYNLSHIYIYEDEDKSRLIKSIKLLIESAKQNFSPSIKLLCIASIKLFGFNIEIIMEELNKLTEKSSNLLVLIHKMIICYQSESIYNDYYQSLRVINYLYDFNGSIISTKSINKSDSNSTTKITKEITKEFYQSFEKDSCIK